MSADLRQRLAEAMGLASGPADDELIREVRSAVRGLELALAAGLVDGGRQMTRNISQGRGPEEK